MARTASVFTCVEPSVKEQAEEVLEQLGISNVKCDWYVLRQVALQRGIPFEMKFPTNTPLVLENLTNEQLDIELSKDMWKLMKWSDIHDLWFWDVDDLYEKELLTKFILGHLALESKIVCLLLLNYPNKSIKKINKWDFQKH